MIHLANSLIKLGNIILAFEYLNLNLSDVSFVGEDKSKNKKAGIVCSQSPIRS